jgi:flagellar hook protein FlgE
MPIYGAFAPSISAMSSQSHALNVIGKNIANVTTGGYKRIDTHFATLISAPLARGAGAGADVTEVKSSSDFGGVRTKNFNRIAEQGNVVSSLSDLDIAINGQGMFVLNTGAGGTGETLYTRDGALQVLTGDQLTVNGIGGIPIQVDSGFLADKNGYLLQGAPVDPDGSSSIGTTGDMRVDAFAFSSFFLPTSTGSLTMNLPANDIDTQPQVDTVTIAGAIEAGDQYSITIDGTTVSVTATAGQTLNDVRDALITAINGNATTGAVVTATTAADGVIRITNNNIISTFTSSASATNGGIIVDNTATSAVLQAPAEGTQVNTFSFQMIDSAGATQNIRLTFDKVGLNSWEVRNTTFQTPTAQVDTITLAGSVEAGDQYSITVGGQTAIYTVNGLEAGLTDIRNGLMAALNNNATVASTFLIEPGATAGEFTITARTGGVPFTTAASTTDLNLTQADTLTIGGSVGKLRQVDTLTIGGSVGFNEAGDTYTATINGTAVTYTVTGLEPGLVDIRNAFLAAINADPVVSAAVTATAGGPNGDIILTSNAAGTPFTSAAGLTDIAGGVNDSSAVVVNTATGSNETGDTYTATINGTPVTYTVTGLEPGLVNVRNAFLAKINADPVVSAAVTATAGGPNGDIILTSNAAGAPFTSAASFTDTLGGVNDSSSAVVNTTAGSNGDNTAAAVTTTANVPQEVVSAPTSMTFDGAGNLTSASTLNLAFAFQGGATGALALDLVDVTQFAGEFIGQAFNRNGFGLALMTGFNLNTHGEVVGEFDDQTFRTIYRIPLADFVNVDGLERRNGNTFVQSVNSGSVTLAFVGGPDSAATFIPNAHELSNVDLATEFTEMITVQTAFNAASKSFTTIDEMLTVARDLKR